MNIITLTIGIPAFNEEENIIRLIKRIYAQKQTKFRIKKIIIVDDASTDKTQENIKSLQDKNITLITNKKREGQIFCQNLIFSLSTTDAVLLFEADTIPVSSDYIDHLVDNTSTSEETGIVSGNMQPANAKTFFGKVLTTQFRIFSNFYIKKSIERNPIPSGRGGRLFFKHVYAKLRWPKNVPEDEYAYLWCMKNNIKFILKPKAKMQFSMPEVFAEYKREMQKNKSSALAIAKHFPQQLIKETVRIQPSEKIELFLTFFITNPFYAICFMLIKLRLQFAIYDKPFTDFWQKRSTI